MSEFLTPIIRGFTDVLNPLFDGLGTAEDFELFLTRYGWDAEITSGDMNAVNTAFALLPVLEALIERLDTFINGINEDRARSALELVLELKNAIDKISNFGSPGGALPAPLDQASFWSELSENLVADLLSSYLEQSQPVLFGILHFAGVIQYTNETPAGANRLPFIRTVIDFGSLGNFFASPQSVFEELYGWNQPGQPLDHEKLFRVLERSLMAFGLPASVHLPRQSLADAFLHSSHLSGGTQVRELVFPIIHGVSPTDRAYWNIGAVLLPIPDPAKSSGDLTGFAVMPLLEGELSFTTHFTRDIYMRMSGAFEAENSMFLNVQPGKTEVQTDLTDAEFAASIELVGDPETPWILFGSPDSYRLELGGFRAGLTLQGNLTDPEVVLKFGTGDPEINRNPHFSLVIQPAEGDGFITDILSTDPITIDFGGNFIWSSKHGFAFEGQAGFELALPLHLELGPLEITTLYLAMRGGNVGGESQLTSDFGIGIKGELGPLTFVIENIGASLKLEPVAPGEQGAVGSHDLQLGFKPPNGVGLSVDAGVVQGGGYLFLDYDRGEYAGALELTFSQIISLKAIGVITTKMPDGSDGFSLIIIITAEFGTPIQLGFGFTLIAVGGLLGLNRTMNLQPLAEGVRNGSINSVMFPTDVVANAPKIISDLRTFFPPEANIFLIGPMAKIGYGTPTLISVSLGIIIEIPGNIAILGVLKVALPTEEQALILLQINFIGAIEFDKQRLWFFASLYDSRILFITLEGEVGLLVGWGDDANFVVSVGGFHPAFAPPPLPFPSPKRLAVSILNESWAMVRVEGYFAVTSNTVQFGASVEIRFDFSAIRIDGHIGFDALFQFSPFYFIISLSASFSLKVFGIGLFSVGVKMALEGPTPWRAKGTGKISFLFFSVSANFDVTWGEEENTTLPPIEAMPLVVAEFAKIENWKAETPASNSLLVSLRTIDATTDLVLHPVGTLHVSQRTLPLGLTLEKIGNQSPSDVSKITVSAGNLVLSKKRDLSEKFAMAQFQEMENAEKLSRPSFEDATSGIELSVSGDETRTGKGVKRHIRYEQIIIDTNYKRYIQYFYVFLITMFQHFLKGNSVAKSEMSLSTKKSLEPFDETIIAKPFAYSVAYIEDNKAMAGAINFDSAAAAREFLKQQTGADPNLADAIHVIPNHELNPAA